MNKNILKDNRGIAPLIIVAIIAGALIIVGGGIYLIFANSPAQRAIRGASKAQNALDKIGGAIPDLNFSQSPLPDLNSSSLNVTAASLASGSIFTAPTVNTDFSYDSSSIKIATPTVDASMIKMPSAPTGAPSDVPSGTQGPPTTIPTGGQQTGSQPSGQQGGAPTVDCSQFASVPSCSMTGSGYDMCKQCFPNK
jgi:hypothetical protein